MHYIFFFNDTATTEIYTLSLHDALPICNRSPPTCPPATGCDRDPDPTCLMAPTRSCSTETIVQSMLSCCLDRSEEHTSELQSHLNLVCRLLLEKKKIIV